MLPSLKASCDLWFPCRCLLLVHREGILGKAWAGSEVLRKLWRREQAGESPMKAEGSWEGSRFRFTSFLCFLARYLVQGGCSQCVCWMSDHIHHHHPYTHAHTHFFIHLSSCCMSDVSRPFKSHPCPPWCLCVSSEVPSFPSSPFLSKLAYIVIVLWDVPGY